MAFIVEYSRQALDTCADIFGGSGIGRSGLGFAPYLLQESLRLVLLPIEAFAKDTPEDDLLPF